MAEEETVPRIQRSAGIVFFVRTKRGLGMMDRLGKRRISKPLGWLMLYIMPVAAVVALFLFGSVFLAYLSPSGEVIRQGVRALGIRANFLLPGVNPYIPIIYGYVALVVAVVVHEFSHGIIARSLGMKVKSAGALFVLFVPIGAFVEVDEKQLKAARPRDSARVLAAGSGINLILAFACLGLLLLTLTTVSPAVNGLAVSQVAVDTPQLHSPAYLAGIRPGDFILSINGVRVNNTDYFVNNTAYSPGAHWNITLWRSGRTIELTNITLGQVTLTDSNNKSYVRAYLGITPISYAALKGSLSSYLASFSKSAAPYLCFPAIPACQNIMPFSDVNIIYYSSSLGSLYPILINQLYWIYFVSLNLGIFNALPIYLLDGGQAYEVGLKALGGGRISEVNLKRITTGTTLALLFVLIIVITSPYLF